MELEGLTRRPDEIAQHSHVRAVSADAPGVHRQSQPLGKIQIHSRIVQLRQAETLRRKHAINSRRIHRPGRTATPPRAPRHLVILFPIAFVPSRHFLLDPDHSGSIYLLIRIPHYFGCTSGPEGSPDFRRASRCQLTAPFYSGLFIYSISQPATHFPCLVFQTRYGANCFAKQTAIGGECLPSGSILVQCRR
jgi:hypothetical protein